MACQTALQVVPFCGSSMADAKTGSLAVAMSSWSEPQTSISGIEGKAHHAVHAGQQKHAVEQCCGSYTQMSAGLLYCQCCREPCRGRTA